MVRFYEELMYVTCCLKLRSVLFYSFGSCAWCGRSSRALQKGWPAQAVYDCKRKRVATATTQEAVGWMEEPNSLELRIENMPRSCCLKLRSVLFYSFGSCAWCGRSSRALQKGWPAQAVYDCKRKRVATATTTLARPTEMRSCNQLNQSESVR